jgi:hypothetical protein
MQKITVISLIFIVMISFSVSYVDDISQMCSDKWGHNYEMVLYCIKNQTSAKRSVDNTQKDEISNFCTNKWVL